MTAAEPNRTGTANVIDMGDEALMRDPFGGYSRIREQAPLIRGFMPGVEPVWLVTRYADVKKVLSDSRFVNDPANAAEVKTQNLFDQITRARGIPQEGMKYISAQMGAYDGAEHARLRGLIAPAVSVRRITEMRPRIEGITEDLLDRLPGLAADGVVDLQGHFAYPLSSTVLSELTGIPAEDRPQLQEWRAIVASPSPTGQEKAEVWRKLIAYIKGLVERRRGEPDRGDLISTLLEAQRRDRDQLSDTELITMVIILGVTSQQTAHLVGNGIAALLAHPEQLSLLRENPELMPRAIHELLRWTTVTQLTPTVRYAAEDIEIGGVLVRKGEAVAPMLVAANHDPRMFPDPERLDITRVPDGRRETHVAFGAGPHRCPGASLSSMEAEVAFSALLSRFPDIALAVEPQDLEREPLPGHWRLVELPVRL
ncbi:MAG: cytochrome P450 family protein [Actinomadura sp.]